MHFLFFVMIFLTIYPILARGEAPQSAAKLPGKGAAQHPFLYAGEWDTRKPLEQSIFIVRDGKIAWALSSWKDPDLGPATSIQLLDEPGIVENFDQQR